jgi:HlyD family secretion protein
MKLPTILLLILLLILAAGVGVWMSMSGGVPVETAVVQRGEIRQFVDERGTTRLPETHLITMPFAGRIEKITLEVGDQVGTQNPVARVVPSDLQNEVDEAKAVVARLEASLAENADKQTEQLTLEQTLKMVDAVIDTVKTAEARTRASISRANFAEDFLAKMRRLQAQGARSDEDVDRAEVANVEAGVDVEEDRLTVSMYKSVLAATQIMPELVKQYMADQDLSGAVLEKEKAEAEARLRQVETRQQRGSMFSPVAGVVLAKPIENERFIDGGEVLLEIGELSRLEIEAEVLSQDVVDVKEGQEVEVYGPAVGARLGEGIRATVHKIYPAGFTKVSSLGVEEQRVNVIIRWSPEVLKQLLEEQHLGVDYRVRVRIFTASAANALLVPRSAVFRAADSKWQLFVVRSGRARRVNVDVGLMNDEQVEILAGVDENERVVLAPDSMLADGDRVRWAASR